MLKCEIGFDGLLFCSLGQVFFGDDSFFCNLLLSHISLYKPIFNGYTAIFNGCFRPMTLALEPHTLRMPVSMEGVCRWLCTRWRAAE